MGLVIFTFVLVLLPIAVLLTMRLLIEAVELSNRLVAFDQYRRVELPVIHRRHQVNRRYMELAAFALGLSLVAEWAANRKYAALFMMLALIYIWAFFTAFRVISPYFAAVSEWMVRH